MKKILLKIPGWVVACCILLQLNLVNHVSGQVIQIGEGTGFNNSYSPVSDYASTALTGKNQRYQILYTADEIKALGVPGPAMLDSIAWEVRRINGAVLRNYTIKMKNTPVDYLRAVEHANLQTVYTNPSLVIPDTSWVWLKFQTPFYWNGFDNILVDVCRDTMDVVNTSSATLQQCYFTSSINGRGWMYSFGRYDTICNASGGGSANSNRYNIRMSFRQPTACTGTPVAGTIVPGTSFNVCPGTPLELTSLSPQEVGGLNYQWQYRQPGGTTWANIAGATAPTLRPAPAENVEYRLNLTCTASNQSVNTAAVAVTVNNTTPIFRTLPYAQDFESWQDHCGTLQLPDVNWTSSPVSAHMSWRREDQGLSGGWTENVAPSSYFPYSTTGDHSARVQTSKGPAGAKGNISVYLDCSVTDSAKEMRFDYMSKTGSSNTLTVMLSVDSGNTFTPLEVLGSMGVNATWQSYIIPFSSTSPKTVIRFEAYSAAYQSGDYDMGIDNLRIFPSCSGKPTAGIVNPASACVGEGVQLSVSGNSQNGGLEWQWQESQGINWTDVTGGDVESPTVPLNGDTWYRAIITCINGGLSDTTAPALIKVKPTKECYCASGATASAALPRINIGNVTVLSSGGDTLMTNGDPLPAGNNPLSNQRYTDFTSLDPVDLYLDSTYEIQLRFMTSSATNSNPQMGQSYTKIFIDYNGDGIFDYPQEQIHGKNKPSIHNASGEGPAYRDTIAFTVPNTATPGVTRMRILTNGQYNYDTTLVNVCGPYSTGETEDYLVRLISLPCTGTESVGTVAADDTLFCPGYPIFLENLNPDNTTGPIGRIWQSSPDGNNWTDISGSDDAVTISETFNGTVHYRVKATCALNQLEAYSSAIQLNQYDLCYCPSYADGGFAGVADSSDAGGFSLGDINIPLTGGHLNNPDAVKSYTNHSLSGITELYEDSTYNFTLSHIILRGTHGDARATIFIDYNANGEYDTDEMAYTGVSGATTWRMSGAIDIPRGLTLNTPTGMRLIISNNAGGAADPCGVYVSGETEDFIVQFLENPVGVAHIPSITGNVQIYPNPTTGMVSVQYNGATVGQAAVRVVSITGQEVMSYTLDQLTDGDVVHMDLKGFAAGLYLIHIEADELKATGRVVLQ